MRWRTVTVATVVLVSALVAPRPTWAVRPLFTEEPGTAGAGKFELEVGGEYAKAEGEEGAPSAKLTVGALSWFDLSYEAGVRVVAPEGEIVRAGATDSTLMLKAAWPGESSRPGIGAVVNLRLPTGDADRGLGEPGTDVLVRGIVGQTVGPLTLFANGGYTFVTGDRTLDTWFFSAAGIGSATERLLILGEVISTVGSDLAEDEVLGRLGVAYAFTERVRGDIGLAIGLNRAAPDVVVTLGVTIVLR